MSDNGKSPALYEQMQKNKALEHRVDELESELRSHKQCIENMQGELTDALRRLNLKQEESVKQ